MSEDSKNAGVLQAAVQGVTEETIGAYLKHKVECARNSLDYCILLQDKAKALGVNKLPVADLRAFLF